MLNFLRTYAAPLALAAFMLVGGYQVGYDRAEKKYQEVIHNEYVEKQVATQRTQQAVSKVSREYQDELAGIEGSTDRIIDGLRSDNKRLRVKLKASSGTITSDGRCESATTGELDESTAKRLIGITQRGDAQIDALIKTVKALQQDNERLTSSNNNK